MYIFDYILYVSTKLYDEMRLTKRAPGGWDSARFLGLLLNDGGFPFRELVLPSRR